MSHLTGAAAVVDLCSLIASDPGDTYNPFAVVQVLQQTNAPNCTINVGAVGNGSPACQNTPFPLALAIDPSTNQMGFRRLANMPTQIQYLDGETIDPSEAEYVLVNADAADVNLNIIPGATCVNRIVRIKRIDTNQANLVTVTAVGTQIDGVLNGTITLNTPGPIGTLGESVTLFWSQFPLLGWVVS